ncbi:MAG: CHAT domain-containing protein [Prevotellaceae bacterium]|nr:CHAT domain-containing protein [Candidatus Faecinaster equi]
MDKLSSLIWSPLIDSLHIQPSEHIFFAADGDLYQIPIEYLPYDATQTMSDVFNIHRVSSTRNIVQLAIDTVRDGITLYGGLIYSIDTAAMKQNATQSVKYANRDVTIEESFGDSLRTTRAYINYLPGTLEEINTIKQYFSDTVILTGTMGNEESFKAMSGQGPHILHIGTHGYYLRPSSSEVRSEGIIDYSMSRTGLLLAGAQLAWSGEPVPEEIEDGILTAKEISTLDLQNVQIAVLSACETGTGEITSDGVAGLQRGFKKAGVQTLIMSLWKVDDNATQLLMKEFYHHWMNGKSKHEALRLAQNAVRYAVDEDGDRMFENPVYWAGFIMLD